MTLTPEHFYLFNAIKMWIEAMFRLCDEDWDSQAFHYLRVSEAATFSSNATMEFDMDKVIDDFHDYFFMKQHICHINELDKLDNNYGLGEHKFPLYDMLQKIDKTAKYPIFCDITLYVFHLMFNPDIQETLKLKLFEDEEKISQLFDYTNLFLKLAMFHLVFFKIKLNENIKFYIKIIQQTIQNDVSTIRIH
jgi:hypothetical protein